MLLLVDAGNTNTVFGVADLDSNKISAILRFSSSRERTADEWLALLRPHLPQPEHEPDLPLGMIVSSVVPAMTRHLVDLGRRHFQLEPLVVNATFDLGIRIEVDAPNEVGTDRLVNSAYAFARYGGPTVVIDLGTGTKIEVITEDGAFIGGVIAPGLGLSLDALANRAARLYAVELAPPPAAIGRNTVAAVQSGVVIGHVAMIEGMLNRIVAECCQPRRVVLTGGYSSAVAGVLDGVTDHVPDMTLLGLRMLYDRNRPVAP
jgi:type III pantothenate kinase